MNAEQLLSTTMCPDNRTLVITIENAADADMVFSMLMGESCLRREFIEETTYANIDV